MVGKGRARNELSEPSVRHCHRERYNRLDVPWLDVGPVRLRKRKHPEISGRCSPYPGTCGNLSIYKLSPTALYPAFTRTWVDRESWCSETAWKGYGRGIWVFRVSDGKTWRRWWGKVRKKRVNWMTSKKSCDHICPAQSPQHLLFAVGKSLHGHFSTWEATTNNA